MWDPWTPWKFAIAGSSKWNSWRSEDDTIVLIALTPNNMRHMNMNGARNLQQEVAPAMAEQPRPRHQAWHWHRHRPTRMWMQISKRCAGPNFQEKRKQNANTARSQWKSQSHTCYFILQRNAPDEVRKISPIMLIFVVVMRCIASSFNIIYSSGFKES